LGLWKDHATKWYLDAHGKVAAIKIAAELDVPLADEVSEISGGEKRVHIKQHMREEKLENSTSRKLHPIRNRSSSPNPPIYIYTQSPNLSIGTTLTPRNTHHNTMGSSSRDNNRQLGEKQWRLKVEKYVYTHGKVSANKTLMLTRLHGSLFG